MTFDNILQLLLYRREIIMCLYDLILHFIGYRVLRSSKSTHLIDLDVQNIILEYLSHSVGPK